MKKTTQRIKIGLFLIIGTLLALYLTISGGYDLFVIHNAIMFRGNKFAVIAIYAILPLLFIVALRPDIADKHLQFKKAFHFEFDFCGDTVELIPKDLVI